MKSNFRYEPIAEFPSPITEYLWLFNCTLRYVITDYR